MSRAIVTHFDGDPFTINAWLILYDKYWRGECDTVYVTMYYNGKIIPENVIQYSAKLFEAFPEIKLSVIPQHQPPELGNHDSLLKVKEDYIGLIESDGLIYSRGVVDQCFRLLENENQDIVAPAWDLITEPYFNGDLHSKGFMRCFSFIRKSILDKTDLDFYPKRIPVGTKLTDKYTTGRDVDLDCFGWMSWQMLLLTNKVTYTPANVLGPDNILSPYSNFKWVHIRQMSSSALGLGGSESILWTGGSSREILKHIMRVFNEHFPNGPAEYTYIKAIAFKLLFFDMMINKKILGHFSDDYRQMLEMVIDYFNLPKQKIYEIKGFYKGLFNI
jgi:hypothetical protein